MTNPIQKLFIALLVLAGLLDPARAAVTFTLTPAAISNTYAGIITLQIAGLTNTETVVMQKFLDANSNGIVDAGDILWQQFQLTDGQASLFTNGTTTVTNFNVPGDNDGSVNGSITAKLYPGLDFTQLITGKYLYVLSSPAGHFPPLTNTFAVTNFPFPQSISGSVFHNTTNVPNAVVILFQPSNGSKNAIGGAVANNSGTYVITAPPGTYQLAGFKTNFIASLAASPMFTLNSGATLVTNVPLTNATASISGKVISTNSPGAGLPGMLIACQTSDNLLAIAGTDTNGNFTVGVTADLWKLQPNQPAVDFHGCIESNNDSGAEWNTTTGSVSGVTIGLVKATAVFYGTVKYSTGSPIAGIQAEGDGNVAGQYGSYSLHADTFTNGNYVLGTLAGDTWETYVNGDDQPAAFTNYLFSESTSQSNDSGVNPNQGQALPQNFTALLATNYITGHVQDTDSNPDPNLGININATINSAQYQNHADTDSQGNYSINAANGDWDLSLNCGGGGDGLANLYPGGNFECPNDQEVTINKANSAASFTVQLTGGQIYGHVLDNYSQPVVDVDVYANDGMGDTYATNTDDTGYYTLNVSENANWDLSVDCGQLTVLGYQCVNDDYVAITNNNGEADFTVTTGATGPFFSTLGFITPGQFGMTINGSAGTNYTVQMTTNLASGNWATLLATNPATGTFQFTDPHATNRARYYRLLIGP